MLSHSNILTKYNKSDRYGKDYLQTRPDFNPPLAFKTPTRMMAIGFTPTFHQPHIARPSSNTGMRGEGLLMTFDRDKYRDHIKPLNLPQEQEDQLLDDLWALSEALVDQSLSSPFYPLQLALTCEAFDAVEKAIVLESQHTPTKKEETCQ